MEGIQSTKKKIRGENKPKQSSIKNKSVLCLIVVAPHECHWHRPYTYFQLGSVHRIRGCISLFMFDCVHCLPFAVSMCCSRFLYFLSIVQKKHRKNNKQTAAWTFFFNSRSLSLNKDFYPQCAHNNIFFYFSFSASLFLHWFWVLFCSKEHIHTIHFHPK